MRLRHIRKTAKALSLEKRKHITYQCTFVSRRLLGNLIKRGNKVLAEKIFDRIMMIVRLHVEEHPLIVLAKVLLRIAPKLTLRHRRKGSGSVLVPQLISYDRGVSVAVRSLLKEAAKRTERGFADRVAAEICDIVAGKQTLLIKQVTNIHKNALSNRANLS